MAIHLSYLLLFILGFSFTRSLVPSLINFCLKNKLADYPDERKIHKKPIPRLGGISIFAGSIFSMLISYKFFSKEILENIDISILIIIFLGGFILFLIGIADDIKSISPWGRLFFQILVSLILWNNHLAIKFIDISWIGLSNDNVQMNTFLSVLITIIWITGITNAINWLDGLDGLATGITFILSTGFFIISCLNNQSLGCLLAINIAACCFGFWQHNKYPAKIFMGDGGSYYLGYNLGILGIVATSTTYIENTAFLINPLLTFLILFLPILDMTFVICRRIASGKSPFYPDCRHIHHRLINFGFNKRLTTKLIFFISSLGIFPAVIFRLLLNEKV